MNKNVRAMRAADRVLKKLPVKASDLTMPERSQLRRLEREGLIRYDEKTEQWVRSI